MYKNEEFMKALRAGKSAMSKYLALNDIDGYLSAHPLGSLRLPTGKIVAADPICLYDLAPLTKQVEPGEYPVWIYLLHCGGDRSVAAAEIRFSENIPVSYTMAMIPEDEENVSDEYDPDNFMGYSVETGIGGFMDEKTALALEKIDDETLAGWTVLDETLDRSYKPSFSVALVSIPGSEEENGKGDVAAFSAGYGDDLYPSYWGTDENGDICSLVTDFRIANPEAEI